MSMSCYTSRAHGSMAFAYIIFSLFSRFPVKWSGDDDDEDQCTAADFPVHHIPLNIIVTNLTELRELRLNFGMIYMNDGFEWRDFE